MKTTLLSIIGMLLMGELMAGHTKVTFFSERGEAFILTVNGQKVNHRPATSVHLNNLYGGRNRVRVRIQGRYGAAVITKPIFIEEGLANEFAISGGPRRGYRVEKVAVIPTHDRRGPREHRRLKEREYYLEGDHYKKPHHGNKGNRRGSVHHVEYVNMNAIVSSLSYYHFDRERLSHAKRAVSGKMLYAKDVARLMKEFTFEDAKLDFAVFAYKFTADQDNYYKVKKAFTFRSTARDLDRRLGY